jgi:signal transduction histidine kinase
MEWMPMTTSPPRRPNLLRQAAILTFGVWIFTFILFLMPVVAATGRLPNFAIGITALDVAFGMALSAPLYWVAARLHEAPIPLKIGGVFIAVCAAAFGFALFDAVTGGQLIRIFMAAHRIPADVVNRTVSNFISFSWLYGWLGTTYAILHTNAAMKERELQLVEARSLAQTAQLTALRLQLNPHFLFNTLNSISTLVLLKQTERANAMLSRLSSFLRYTLVNESTGMVTVAQEIETLKLYLEIEKMRFEARLRPHFHIDPTVMRAHLPSLLLQPLVENAIKYAVTPQEEGADISIEMRREADRVFITVSDSGPGADSQYQVRAAQSTGVGLANIRDRLAQAYGDNHRFETQSEITGGFRVFIEIPYQIEAEEPK